MIKKIHCIYIFVNDIQESTEFYENILGLKATLKEENWVEFKLNNCVLALYKNKGINKVNPNFLNFVFEVKDIEKEFFLLKSKGVIFCEEIKEHSFGKTAVIEDPNGHKIELLQPLTKKERIETIVKES